MIFCLKPTNEGFSWRRKEDGFVVGTLGQEGRKVMGKTENQSVGTLRSWSRVGRKENFTEERGRITHRQT